MGQGTSVVYIASKTEHILKNAIRFEERTEHGPKSNEHYTLKGQMPLCASIPGRCFHLLQVYRKSRGLPRDCTKTTSDIRDITKTERMLLLQRLHRLPGSHSAACHAFCIDKRNQCDLWTTTSYQHHWTQIIYGALQCKLTVCTKFRTTGRTNYRKIRKVPGIPVGTTEPGWNRAAANTTASTTVSTNLGTTITERTIYAWHQRVRQVHCVHLISRAA